MENSYATWTAMMAPLGQWWLTSSAQAWKPWLEGWEKVGESGTANPQEFMALYAQGLRQLFETWQTLTPTLQQGDWRQSPLQGYFQGLEQQMAQYQKMAERFQGDSQGLWALYVKEVQKFTEIGFQAWHQQSGESGFILPQVYWDNWYGAAVGELGRSPLLGPGREVNGKLLRAFDAWVELYRSMADYQGLEARIQYDGMVALMDRLGTLAKAGKGVKTWREFQQVWAIAADEVFERAFCQEENLKIRGRFINALNRYRLQYQGLMEDWQRAMNLPTRSEVDEIHQTLYQLRKEVKTLKKRLAQYEPEGDPA